MTTFHLETAKKIHFIGIGGVSMSGLAEILMERGKQITGSDWQASSTTDHLRQLGIPVHIGHDAVYIDDDTDLVVYTAAIPADNPERLIADQKGIPCIERAVLLGRLMASYPHSIGVAGTHGKTTTTSMFAHVLMKADKDPTISVGAHLNLLNSNYRSGNSAYFLLEACEYKNSFHHFHPQLAIVLNIAADHLDFFADYQAIYQSFQTYLANVPANGSIVVNQAIPDIDLLTANSSAKIIRFGQTDADITYKNLTYQANGCPAFDVYHHHQLLGHLALNVYGHHNVLNALAVVAGSLSLDIPFNQIQAGLEEFTGSRRRLEYKGDLKGVLVYDDYAHHPEEIESTLDSLSHIPHDRLWFIFQPHTYSRTKALFDDFVRVLKPVDNVILADIYAAREKDPGDISSQDLYQALKVHNLNSYFFDSFEKIENFILQQCRPGDLLITVGAGNIYLIGDGLLG